MTATVVSHDTTTSPLLDACAILSWLDPDGTDLESHRVRIDEVFGAVDGIGVNRWPQGSPTL